MSEGEIPAGNKILASTPTGVNLGSAEHMIVFEPNVLVILTTREDAASSSLPAAELQAIGRLLS